jgi:hypothetical protein
MGLHGVTFSHCRLKAVCVALDCVAGILDVLILKGLYYSLNFQGHLLIYELEDFN